MGGVGASVAAGVLLAAGVAPAVSAAPVRYEIQAWTMSGLGAAVAGGGLSAGTMMNLLMGGAPTAVRSLQLTLRADGASPPAPQADHRIPAGLGLGPSLSLATPTPSPARGSDGPSAGETELPKGRLLVYRGCTEDNATSEPEVLEFAKLVPDQQAIARALASAGRLQGMAEFGRPGQGVVGQWPHGASSPAVPAAGSLVGSHVVTSNYAPEIAFTVDRDHDFLAPVQLQTTPAAGSWQLSWQPIPTVLGYQAMVTGPGRQEGDLVIWTSSQRSWSESPIFGAFALGGSDGDALARQGVLMGPERTRCTIVPAAMQQMQAGVLHFSAFGSPLKVQAPGPNPAWQVDLERQAMVIQPLVEGLTTSPSGGSGPGSPGGSRDSGGPFNLFRGLF